MPKAQNLQVVSELVGYDCYLSPKWSLERTVYEHAELPSDLKKSSEAQECKTLQKM